MLMKLFLGLTAVAGLAASRPAATASAGPCCYPGSECCFAGSPCRETFASADAEQPAKAATNVSKIVVDEMSCAGCAKTVTKAVSVVAGVESAAVDLKSQTVTVTPKPGEAPSAKDLWEAVEKAGYKPTKFDGPGGTFNKKPAK